MDPELTYYADAKAYRYLSQAVERHLHHANDSRMVTISALIRALNKARTIARGDERTKGMT